MPTGTRTLLLPNEVPQATMPTDCGYIMLVRTLYQYFVHAGSSASFLHLTPKRPRYFDLSSQDESATSQTLSDDEESDEDFDPESYYTTDPGNDTPDDVKKFLESTFKRCLPRKRRRAIAREYPKPNLDVIKVPKADKDISNILDQSFPIKSDKQLSRIQAAILASSGPLTSLWSQMSMNGFTGKSDELISTKDVMKVIRESLALIGNASSYVSQNRRLAIVDRVKESRPQLASFLKEVCSEDMGDSGRELFGPAVKKKLGERADTIKAFNEALTKLDPPAKTEKDKATSSHFLGRGSDAKYGGSPSYQHSKPYTNHRVFRWDTRAGNKFNHNKFQSNQSPHNKQGKHFKKN